MVTLTDQQQLIVDAPLEPMSVVACAGSGKTKTAVSRLLKVKTAIEQSRSHVALLSFSNTAVNTFRETYYKTAKTDNGKRVTIDTFDGFITSNILRPHAYRTMACKVVPFLITGSEPWLQNKKFSYWYDVSPIKKYPVKGLQLHEITVGFGNEELNFYYHQGNKKHITNNGIEVTKNLGAIGAYTHELGKYWSLATLMEQPNILKVLAHRYPHIIVDEAQDIGELHQYILEALIEKGVKVTLIGDPNQAIYEFAGATGDFITTFNDEPKNDSYELSLNYRSIQSILNVANKVSGRKDKAANISDNIEQGAYYAVYDTKKSKDLVETFTNKLAASGLSPARSAVLCRAQSGIDNLQIASKEIGQGKIQLLALAALQRDLNMDFQKAFRLVTSCIVGLLNDTPDNLSSTIVSPAHDSEVRNIRQDIWRFVRSPDKGLPSSLLNGGTEWHKLVKDRVIELLDTIEKRYGYSKVSHLGNKLAKTGLVDKPLMPDPELAIHDKLPIRVSTVHQAKGESLDAVLYIATKVHIDAMLNGVGTEVGRIGYVAITRARKLFILGVPKNAEKTLSPKLQALGLTKL